MSMKIDVSWIFCYLRLSDTARYCAILPAFAGYFVVRIVVRKSRPQQGFSGGSPGQKVVKNNESGRRLRKTETAA